MLKSVDDGQTWTDLTAYAHPDDANYRDPHRLVIRPDDRNVFYLATGNGVCRSGDGGASWQLISDQVAPVAKGDHHLPFLSREEREKAIAQRGLERA